jgi:hypothetical protein
VSVKLEEKFKERDTPSTERLSAAEIRLRDHMTV